MPMTNALNAVIAAALTGNTYTAFNAANASLGVGDSSAAYAAAQTDLQASTNKLRRAMDATYPQLASATMTFRSTFVEADANFAWNEWGVFNTTSQSGGTMMVREVQSLGTKPSNQQWRLTVDVTVSVGV